MDGCTWLNLFNWLAACATQPVFMLLTALSSAGNIIIEKYEMLFRCIHFVLFVPQSLLKEHLQNTNQGHLLKELNAKCHYQEFRKVGHWLA